MLPATFTLQCCYWINKISEVTQFQLYEMVNHFLIISYRFLVDDLAHKQCISTVATCVNAVTWHACLVYTEGATVSSIRYHKGRYWHLVNRLFWFKVGLRDFDLQGSIPALKTKTRCL